MRSFSASAMLEVPEEKKVQDSSKANLADLVVSLTSMQGCSIKTDWLEANLRHMAEFETVHKELLLGYG